jgi:hypothetical protein
LQAVTTVTTCRSPLHQSTSQQLCAQNTADTAVTDKTVDVCDVKRCNFVEIPTIRRNTEGGK